MFKKLFILAVIILILLILGGIYFFFPKLSYEESGALWFTSGNKIGETFDCWCFGFESGDLRICKSCNPRNLCYGLVLRCKTTCFKRVFENNSTIEVTVPCE
jgi:hypothetical protein